MLFLRVCACSTQPLPPVAREYASVIMSCGTILGGLISDILDFSKITAGKVVLQPTHTDIFEFFLDIANIMRATYKPPPSASTVQFILDFDTSVPTSIVKLDQVRLRQIVVNLVANAFKFTDQGSVHLSVSCAVDAPKAKEAHFRYFLPERAPSPKVLRRLSEMSARGRRRCSANCSSCIQRFLPRVPFPVLTSPEPSGGKSVTLTGDHDYSGQWDCEAARPVIKSPLSKLGSAVVMRRSIQLIISVKDTGIGVAPVALQELFKPFVQASTTSRSQTVGGTGLGLAISRSLSELMGGRLSCTSTVSMACRNIKTDEEVQFATIVARIQVVCLGDGASPACAPSPR